MHRLGYSLSCCFVVFACLAATGAAAAQAALDVSVVVEGTGRPAPGIDVTLRNEAIGTEQRAQTNEQGRIRFEGLTTAGMYRVSAGGASTIYTEASVDRIQLRTNEVRSILLVLPRRLESDLAEITVRARPVAQVNATNAEVSATLQPAEVQALPMEGRDITRALYRLPGVTQATGFYPEAPNVSINGASALSASYLIDGLGNNENFLGGQKFPIPVGMVQDVSVLTSSFSAEFGRTSTGVINITTRSGSNEWGGEGFYVVRPGSVIDAASPYAGRDLSGNLVKDGFQRHQVGAAFGGPLARDRTFLYANLEQTLDLKDNLLNASALGINAVVPGQNRFTLGSARIDHRWGDRARTTGRLHIGDVAIERQGGGLDGGLDFPSAGSTQIRQSALAAIQTTALLGNWISETGLQASRFRWDYARTNDGGVRVNVLGPDGRTVAGLGNPGSTFDDLETTFQLQQKLSRSFGTHSVRFGADVVASDFALKAGGPQTGAYTVQLTQPQLDALRDRELGSSLALSDIPADVQVVSYAVELRPSAFGMRQTQVAGFVEDQWSAAPNLTFTAGLRYDYDTLSKGGAASGDWNNVAPRLSANLRLDPRTSVRAGYGLFYDKILYAVVSDALQQNSTADGFRDQLEQLVDLGLLPSDTDIDRVTFDGTLTVDATDLTPGFLLGPTAADVQARREGAFAGERRILNPNGYDNPSTHQFSVGLQRQVASDALFAVDVIHTRSQNLFRLRDLNAPSAYAIDPQNVVVRSSANADATRPVAFRDGSGATIPGAARNIVVSETKGEARYWAATATLLRERSATPLGVDAGLRLSYTLSSLRNNTDDINFRAQDANDFGAEWGPSLNDRRHVVNGVVYAYPVSGLSIAVAALVQSGQPVSRVPNAALYGTTDLNGNGDNRDFSSQYTGGTDRHPGESRNSDRLPWSSQVDLGVGYEVPVAGQRVEVRADAFNLFNATNLSGYSNNATVSNQIQTGAAGTGITERSAGPPRQFQFTVRVVL